MSWLGVLAADQLDEFLEGAGSGTRLGEQLGTIGASIAIPALVVAIGMLAFVKYVHDGREEEVATFTRFLTALGVVILVGSVIQVYGARLVVGEGWPTQLLGGTLRGGAMRAIAGAALSVGFFRFEAASKRYLWGVAGAGIGVVSLALTGHTVSEGNVILLVATDVVHVVAAGIWLGGLVGLTLVFLLRRPMPEGSVVPMVVRFSSLATLLLVSVAGAGVAMSFLIIETMADYLTTAWGRVLLIKVGLVLVAAGIGAYNHYVVVPGLERDPDEGVLLRRARITVTTEAILLVGVAFVSVLLTEAPTN